jgi:hypothetical protein
LLPSVALKVAAEPAVKAASLTIMLPVAVPVELSLSVIDTVKLVLPSSKAPLWVQDRVKGWAEPLTEQLPVALSPQAMLAWYMVGSVLLSGSVKVATLAEVAPSLTEAVVGVIVSEGMTALTVTGSQLLVALWLFPSPL